MISNTIKFEAAAAIRAELFNAIREAGGHTDGALGVTATRYAEELTEAAITYLDDYLASELHYTANAAAEWLASFGASLDTWEVAEHAAAQALGNY